MTIEEINYSALNPVKKKCIVFADDGNTIVKPYKTLYSLEEITHNTAHKELYICVVQGKGLNSHLIGYDLYNDIGVICRKIGYIQSETSLDRLVEDISKFEYWGAEGFLKLLTDLESTEKWISNLDIEICALLGKSELVKHYTEYKAEQLRKREERNRQKELERKARKEAEERERLDAIEKQITGAENSFRSRTRISNFEVDGKSVILYLMKKYGVNVPLKTQGWINNALANIYWKNDAITYQYYTSSRDSTVFSKYLEQLEKKIIEAA